MCDDKKCSDIVEVEINGEKWWRVNGYNEMRPEDRKLKEGDAIVYHQRGGYAKNYVMIIKSFDFNSDISARALIGSSPYRTFDGKVNISYYSDFAPSFNEYRMATREEVRQFLNEYKDNNASYNLYIKKIKIFNNPIYKDLL